MFSLKNRVVLITGASQGIGASIAKTVALQGAITICSDLPSTESALKITVQNIKDLGCEADYVLLDVTNKNNIQTTMDTIIKQYNTIHILINNAGINRDRLILNMKEEEFEIVLNTNLKGPWLMIKEVIKLMTKQRWGRIINISSIAGQMGNIGQSNYSASKAGLIGLTKTIAREFANRNITCNAIAPGYISTAMTNKLKDNIKMQINQLIPIGRMGSTDDIANAVIFLASDEANYITGQTLNVNGGMLM